jgi:hypothetical protein
VRVIQDVVELVADRADFILRLAMNRRGTDLAEMHGVNVALLSIAMGAAIGLDRRQLVDLGVAGLFHHVACRRHRFEGKLRLGRDVTLGSLGHLMYQSGAGTACHARAAIVAEHRHRAYDLTGTHEPSKNVPARILGLATAFEQLTGGFGTRHEALAHPLEVLGVLVDDVSGRFDADLVDLLVNVLRAFPERCEVVLDDNSHAVVQSHLGSSRWDRPIVQVIGSRTTIDLMSRKGDRFVRRIVGTPRYCGRSSRLLEDQATVRPETNVGSMRSEVVREEHAPRPARDSVDTMLRDYLSDGDDGPF